MTIVEEHLKTCPNSIDIKENIATKNYKGQKVFRTRKILKGHQEMVHQDPSIRTCQYCQLVCDNKAELYKHYQKKHPYVQCPIKIDGDLVLQCFKCDKILASKTALYTHIKKSHKLKMSLGEVLSNSDVCETQCPDCLIMFSSYIEAVNHYLDNHSDHNLPDTLQRNSRRKLKFNCVKCVKWFKTVETYSEHRKECKVSSN